MYICIICINGAQNITFNIEWLTHSASVELVGISNIEKRFHGDRGGVMGLQGKGGVIH